MCVSGGCGYPRVFPVSPHTHPQHLRRGLFLGYLTDRRREFFITRWSAHINWDHSKAISFNLNSISFREIPK